MHIIKLIYRGWMKFAHALGWVNTRILLTIVYFVMLTPIAIIFKLIGKDPMERKFSGQPSYWHKVEDKKFRAEDYRRQF